MQGFEPAGAHLTSLMQSDLDLVKAGCLTLL